MAYNETYVASDADNIILDLLGTIVVVMVGFGSLIGLAILFKWFKKNK